MGADGMRTFEAWLLDRHGQVKRLEKEAYATLQPGRDAEYRKLMRAKADLLAGIAADAEPLLNALPPAAAAFARDELAGFSANARESIQLASIFYMAQLLYPEDYREGDPDNFEQFIAELKEFSS